MQAIRSYRLHLPEDVSVFSLPLHLGCLTILSRIHETVCILVHSNIQNGNSSPIYGRWV